MSLRRNITWTVAVAVAVFSLGLPATGHSAPVAKQAAAGMATTAFYNVMPLGDSITWGYTVKNGTPVVVDGYRKDLWTRLRNVGLNVNFVGSCPRPTWDQWKCNGEGTMGDNNHEGHSGYRIDQLSTHVTSWVQTYQPSAVLLMVGTNDIAQNYDLPNAPARLSQLIDKILAARPNAVRVFVGSIIQFGSSVHDAEVKAYNDAVYRITQNKGAHVHFVPNHIIGKERGDLADGVHPTDCGYAKLSYLWYTYMEPELSSGWWPTGYWPWSYTGVCAR